MTTISSLKGRVVPFGTNTERRLPEKGRVPWRKEKREGAVIEKQNLGTRKIHQSQERNFTGTNDVQGGGRRWAKGGYHIVREGRLQLGGERVLESRGGKLTPTSSETWQPQCD